ncbi:hypothetical protein Tsubulata_034078, partial [Turnera subulata]
MATSDGIKPTLFTKKCIIVLIFSSEQSINIGCTVSADPSSVSDQPRLLRSSSFLSRLDLLTREIQAIPKMNDLLPGSNPIALASSIISLNKSTLHNTESSHNPTSLSIWSSGTRLARKLLQKFVVTPAHQQEEQYCISLKCMKYYPPCPVRFFLTKPFDNSKLTTEHLGMIFLSKLSRNTFGYMATLDGIKPTLFTKKCIILLIFSSEQSISIGCTVSADPSAVSDQPRLLRSSSFLSRLDLLTHEIQ